MKGLLEKREVMEREYQPDIKNWENAICATCVHNGRCVYQGRSSGPIFSCDEFETESPFRILSEIPLESEKTVKDNVFKGLCSNCELRHNCMMADTVSGVWHCEEYL